MVATTAHGTSVLFRTRASNLSSGGIEIEIEQGKSIDLNLYDLGDTAACCEIRPGVSAMERAL